MMMGHDEQNVQRITSTTASPCKHSLTHQNIKESFVYLQSTEVGVARVTGNAYLFFFVTISGTGGRTGITIKIMHVHITVMFLVSYIQLNLLLLLAQNCCHLHFGKVANKIQENLPSKE